jgi:hypothetical protein
LFNHLLRIEENLKKLKEFRQIKFQKYNNIFLISAFYHALGTLLMNNDFMILPSSFWFLRFFLFLLTALPAWYTA